jgi:pimeloyl-ACP methyl ester carboxylesterase
MRMFIGVVFLLFCGELCAQDPRKIGFADTLIYNGHQRYTAFGYSGPAPLFVQVWFPLTEGQDTAPLSHTQLRQRSLDGPLRRVYNELLLRMDSAFIEYDLRYPMGGDEPVDYAPFTEQQVKDSLYALGTHAFRAGLPLDADRPVILYHHGSQGLSDENVWMAEHFAANGFIFLSCNFHWPLEGRSYGYPLVWEPDRSSIRTMLRFTRQLANGNKVFYIGHSWGAQEGWCTLHEPGLADAFISLETSMEWKTDTAEVRDKWPHVLEAITTHRYPMPILMVADSDGEPPYPMFRGVQGDIRYLDPKEPFGHESYTGAYLLRLAGEGRFNVPDREAMQRQFDLHAALLEELLVFLKHQAAMTVDPVHHRNGDPFHHFPLPVPSRTMGR